jgi:polysaccharide pyruvyl transferase WcaK-like protein
LEKLRIVFIGYYGRLNAGDDLLQQSLTSLFQEHDLTFCSWVPGIKFLNEVDLVVVGGGSIWPGNVIFQNAKEYAKRLKTPLIVLGVSAKQENIKVSDAMPALLDKTLLFQVRDNESKRLICADSKIVEGTDLFWWVDFDDSSHISQRNHKIVALNLRPWAGEEWSASKIKEVLVRSFGSVLSFPMYFGSAIHEVGVNSQDVELLKKIGLSDTPTHFSPQVLNESGVVVAMRFHALLLAIRAGIPVIGFTYHRKIKALFKELEMEELCVPLEDPVALEYAISQLLDNYDDYQLRILANRDKFLEQGKIDRERLQQKVKGIKKSGTNRLRKFVRAIRSMFE